MTKWYSDLGRRMTDYEKTKKYNSRYPERRRNSQLKAKYGITLQDWEELFKSQDMKCGICKTDDPGKRTWHTDHCHETGKVRGILCHVCNTALGKFKDNVAGLEAAINYLKGNAYYVDHRFQLCPKGR